MLRGRKPFVTSPSRDIDLPSRRITIAGHSRPLGDLTHRILLAWLEYRRTTWPRTANRHLVISRVSALGTGPVAAGYLDKHLLLGTPLERIRRDRILHEALATGADPLHLALVFNIDHTTAMIYAGVAISSSPRRLPGRPDLRVGLAVVLRADRDDRRVHGLLRAPPEPALFSSARARAPRSSLMAIDYRYPMSLAWLCQRIAP